MIVYEYTSVVRIWLLKLKYHLSLYTYVFLRNNEYTFYNIRLCSFLQNKACINELTLFTIEK